MGKSIKLTKGNWKGIFSDLELQRLTENVLEVGNDLSSDEINDIIKKWNNLGKEDNKHYDDTPLSIDLIKDKRLIVDVIDLEIKAYSAQNIESYFKWKNITFLSTVLFEASDMMFYKCTFEDGLLFEELVGGGMFVLEDVKIFGDFGYQTSRGDIGLFNLEIKKLRILDSEISEDINIIHGDIDEIQISNSILKNVTISECITSEIYIEGTSIDKIHIEAIKSNNDEGVDFELRLTGNSHINDFCFYNCKDFNNFIISVDRVEMEYPLSNFKINDLIFSDKSNFLFLGLDMGKLIINNVLILTSKSKLSNLTIEQDFIVNDVDFGRTLFNGVRFGDRCNVFFKLPVFNEIIFNDTNLSDKTLLSGHDYGELNISLREKRNIYRQLKYVMDKSNNYFDGNIFFEKEMTVNKKLCKEEGRTIEYYYYLVQKHLNNYGNNWVKPIGWIVWFSLLGNLINYIYLLLKNIIFFQKIESLSFYEILFNQINLLSPFYGLSFKYFDLIKDDLLLYGGFMIYKIIYGVIIYQLVIALKRNVKR